MGPVKGRTAAIRVLNKSRFRVITYGLVVREPQENKLPACGINDDIPVGQFFDFPFCELYSFLIVQQRTGTLFICDSLTARHMHDFCYKFRKILPPYYRVGEARLICLMKSIKILEKVPWH